MESPTPCLVFTSSSAHNLRARHYKEQNRKLLYINQIPSPAMSNLHHICISIYHYVPIILTSVFSLLDFFWSFSSSNCILFHAGAAAFFILSYSSTICLRQTIPCCSIQVHRAMSTETLVDERSGVTKPSSSHTIPHTGRGDSDVTGGGGHPEAVT